MIPDLPNPHDRFFKEVWSRKAVSRDFLSRYLPCAVVDLLDLRTLACSKVTANEGKSDADNC